MGEIKTRSRIDAEIFEANPIRSDACWECDVRFGCWADRGIYLKGEKVEIVDRPLGLIGVRFASRIRECFPSDSLVGKPIVYYLDDKETKGFIKSYTLHVDSDGRLLELLTELDKYRL